MDDNQPKKLLMVVGCGGAEQNQIGAVPLGGSQVRGVEGQLEVAQRKGWGALSAGEQTPSLVDDPNVLKVFGRVARVVEDSGRALRKVLRIALVIKRVREVFAQAGATADELNALMLSFDEGLNACRAIVSDGV